MTNSDYEQARTRLRELRAELEITDTDGVELRYEISELEDLFN